MQVNGVEAYVESDADAVPLSTNRYLPDVVHPQGWQHLVEFTAAPWPTWTFRIADGVTVQQEIFVARDTCETVLRWRMTEGAGPRRLKLRLLMSGRDYHALHRENNAFDFHAKAQAGNVSWTPYAGLPAVTALTNGTYRHDPEWFRNVLYTAERDRGLDDVEDLASPGVFTWDLDAGAAMLVLRSGDGLNIRTEAYANRLAGDELARRDAVTSPLHLAAESYLVDRQNGCTVLAGFPWFTDWGRDTFIAMRGLVTARGRFSQAEAILGAWASTVSEGMLPNRFVDSGDTPEFNAVDASLWFIIAGHELLEAARQAGYPIAPQFEERLFAAFDAILHAYANGTRFGISADGDGLLRAGVPGVQLTWMDAKVGDWVVTPRIGKPVEIQALWINALHIGSARSARCAELEEHARASFAERFPNPENGGLFDVVDVDHVAGAVDAKIRPNQIFAVGGLPFALVQGPAARRIVELVENRLLTPLGLRSLAPDDPDYKGHYGGDPWHRDAAYHQGTAWPWLMGAFVEAWLRVSADPLAAAAEGRARFLPPLMAHLQTAGLGHVSEIADGDPPHTPRGCPFQAWSLGELIRVDKALRPPPGQRPLRTE